MVALIVICKAQALLAKETRRWDAENYTRTLGHPRTTVHVRPGRKPACPTTLESPIAPVNRTESKAKLCAGTLLLRRQALRQLRGPDNKSEQFWACEVLENICTWEKVKQEATES